MKTLFKKPCFFNQSFLKNQTSWRWLAAILISVLLHSLVISGWQITLPSLDFTNEDIQAELVLPPVKTKKVTPTKKETKKQLAPKTEKSVAPTSDSQLAERHTQTANEIPALEHAKSEEEARPEYEAPKPLPPPNHVNIDFDVKRTGLGSGKARYRFQLEPQGRYSLRSEIEATGLASFAFSGKRVETSMGKVNEQGLQPEAYKLEISNKPEKFQSADFDWVNKQVTLTTAKNKAVLDLPEGTQDFLSFMYQFMFVPPLDRMQHALTNGKTLHMIDYLFVSEEEITTKFGTLNTMHIAKSSGDYEEKTELWLAVDYRYIPIKILKLAKDGSGYELTATRIDTDIKP